MSKKDTIYIDVDDDITSIIDKVKSSHLQIVALVLPKRASVLQSTVNMKLLKRTADQAGKKPVLITSEPALMPLAAASSIHVAPNLQAAPKIPDIPEEEPDIPVDEPAEEVAVDPNSTVGEAMGNQPEEEAEADNTPKSPKPAKRSSSKDPKKSDKKPNVPNFKRFRKWIILGSIALVLLAAFIIWAIFFAPKASVTVQTETSDLAKTIDFTADTEADSIDLDNATLPAISKEIEKTETEQVPATGQKDKGKKASGSITLKNCTKSTGQVKVPSGTGVSGGGLTYITQKAVVLPASLFDGGNNCVTPTKDANVVAQESGEQYNTDPRSYQVSGYNGVIASGSSMTGGTTNVVKVVDQADIASAKKLLEAKQEDATGDLEDELKDENYVPITETMSSDSQYTATPQAGAEATEVSVVATTEHTMLGVKQKDLEELIKKAIEEDINTDTQTVLEFGLDKAAFEIGEDREGPRIQATIQTTLAIGPDLKVEQIKSEIAGKSKSEAEEILKQRPGFTESKVETNFFWVGSVPGNTGKIEVIIQKPDGSEITR
jgi:hypothetical protein